MPNGGSDNRLTEIIGHFIEHGERATLDHFGITSNSLNKIKTEHKRRGLDYGVALTPVMQKIREQYSDAELAAIAAGGRVIPGQDKIPVIDFSGTKFRFCFFTDSHIGSVFFREDMFSAMLEQAKKERVEAFFHAGDVTEGFSNRPGHVYELAQIGYTAQRDEAVRLLSQMKKPIYAVSGNHDRWYIKSNGADIVRDIMGSVPGAEFLGHDSGTVAIKKTPIQLWHGEDSGSYATSYRLQKLVEAMTGGSKPHVLLAGHTHKQGYFFERHIHVFSGGALCLQSNWMRSKRLANHSGFWIITLTLDSKGGVSACNSTWFPYYA